MVLSSLVLAALVLCCIILPGQPFALLRSSLRSSRQHHMPAADGSGDFNENRRRASSLSVDVSPTGEGASNSNASYSYTKQQQQQQQESPVRSGALLRDYIKKLNSTSTAADNIARIDGGSLDTSSIITDYLRICLNKAREGHKATKYHIKDLINVLATKDNNNNIYLSMKMKSALIRVLVLTDEFDELANVVLNCKPVLGREPLPDSFTLENILRVLGKVVPAASLQALLPYHIINARYFNASALSGSGGVAARVLEAYRGKQIILSEQCYAYAIKAIAALKTQPRASTSGGRASIATGAYAEVDAVYASSSNEVIVSLLEMAYRQHGKITTSLLITAMSSSQRLEDFQCAIAIYNFAKNALKREQLVEVLPSNSSGGSGRSKREERVIDRLPPILYGQTVVTLAKGGAEAQTFQVVCEMLASGVVPTAVTVDLALLELSKRGSFNAMLLVVAQLQRFGVRASAMAMNAVLNACDKAAAYRQAVDFFLSCKEDEKSRFALDDKGLSVLIKCCDRLLLARTAADILEAAEASGLEVRREVYERVFAIFVKSGAGTLALRLLRKTEGARSFLVEGVRSPETTARGAGTSVVDLSAIGSGLGRNTRMPMLEFNVKTILSGNYKYDSSGDGGLDDLFSSERDFNLLGGIINVDNYSDGIIGRPEDSDDNSREEEEDILTEDNLEYLEFREQLADLVTSNAPPVAAPNIYAATIASLSRQGLAEEAKELLLSYVRRGGAVNEEMFTSSIYSFRYSKDPGSAEAVFRRLQSLASDPLAIFAGNNSSSRLTISAFNALLSVYAISNVSRTKFDSVLSELDALVDSSGGAINWNSYTYTATLYYLGQQGRDQEMMSLWRAMVASPLHTQPPSSTVNAMLRACILCNNGQGAMEVLEYLLQSGERGKGMGDAAVKVDTSVCNKVLIALNGAKESKESLGLLQKMRELSIPITLSTYTIVLSALEKAADWTSAVNLLLQMQTKGVTVDSKSVNLAISACAKAGEHRMIVKLYELMPTLTNRSFRPNPFTYYSTLNAALCLKNSTLKMSIIDDMITDSTIFPSFATTNLVISLLETKGEFDASVYVFERLVSTHLDYSFHEKDDEYLIDLHGLTTLVSRASVRSALWRMKEAASSGSASGRIRNLVIITGKGKNSKDFLEPVLKPSIQAWLSSEFAPPLRALEVPDNPGRLLVSARDILAWALLD